MLPQPVPIEPMQQLLAAVVSAAAAGAPALLPVPASGAVALFVCLHAPHPMTNSKWGAAMRHPCAHDWLL